MECGSPGVPTTANTGVPAAGTVLRRVVLYRHGQGEHNVKSTPNRLGLPDPPLTPQGEAEARAIFDDAGLHDDDVAFEPDLVFVSPLWRTLQTATLALASARLSGALSGKACPLLALESVREGMNRHACNHRGPISAARAAFPGVDFDARGALDELGPPLGAEAADDMEGEIALVRARAAEVLEQLRGERSDLRAIAVFTHQGFIRNVLSVVAGLGAHHSVDKAKTGGSVEIRLVAGGGHGGGGGGGGSGSGSSHWVLAAPTMISAIRSPTM